MTASSPSGAPVTVSSRSDLKRRIASGVVMATVALALTLAGGWWFAVLVASATALMCWEWGRLTRGTAVQPVAGAGADAGAEVGIDASLIVHVAAVLAAIALVVLGQPLWALSMLAVAAVVLFALAPATPLSAFGAVYVGLPAFALVWLRLDPSHGLAAVLYLFLAVWVTDIAAYAAGRTIGGPKLAPRISPGKTWSGLAGGVAAAGIAGALFSVSIDGASPLRLGGLAIALAIAAQLGDLYESALKRRSGLKDASGIIPGHGGILDRVDGLVAAIALVSLIILLPHADAPARWLVRGY